jgi:hypothetical protein
MFAGYYLALIAEGMPAEHAILLTINYQHATFTQRPPE